jgi:hypothetical protein
MRPLMPQRPQLPDPNVGAAPAGGVGSSQRLQMMQGRFPDFAYDAALKWGPQAAAAMQARNAARQAARSQPMQANPNPSGSPVPQQPNPFRPHGRPY